MDQRPVLEYLISTGPTVIFRRTPADDVTYVSPNVERVLGYTPEEVMDTPGFWSAKVHPEDRDQFDAQMREAFSRRAAEFQRDYRLQHKDGTYRWVHAQAHIEYDKSGAPQSLLGYAVDMTEHRAAEQQTARMWGFPLALLFVAGLDGYFKRVSAGYERLLGWTEQELLSRPFFEFVHPDDLAVLGASMQDVASGGTDVINQEIRIMCKDGTYRWLMGNYSPVLDEGLMYGMAIDITERRDAEEALRESERHTRLILDTAYEAFIAMDIDGRIIGWNTEAERVLGWSHDEAVGRLLAETIVPERYRARHIEGLERYRESGEGPLLGRRIEIEALRRDGSELAVELTISPTRLDHTVTFNAFLRDVSERKASEKALRAAHADAARAQEEAEVANRAKTDFLSRMSHELRTPLNAILGFGQLLDVEDLAEEHRESAEQILRAGRHLLQLIDEVLDVARIEQGQLSLSIEPVPLRDVIRKSLDLVRPLAGAANVHIRTEDANLERHVLADHHRLQQVLMNLLSNAIKYNRSGGTVTLSCEQVAGERLRVAVADTGAGIPSELMDRLFVPFERLGAERTPVEGTGIGLSICKRLVELMGGEIGAHSQVSRGSTFWVEFASVDGPEEGIRTEAEPHRDVALGRTQTRTVLYVEDNLSNLRLVERILARRPATRLIAAMQGGLALDLAREYRPDLILLDVHLPDIDGDEVLRRLREHPETRDIPVVAVSAEATQRKIERFLAAGVRAYLTKPLDLKQFLELVDEILAETAP